MDPLDLTQYNDTDLDALRVAVLTEQERRQHLASIPATIAAMAEQYRNGGGDPALLTLDPPAPFVVPVAPPADQPATVEPPEPEFPINADQQDDESVEAEPGVDTESDTEDDTEPDDADEADPEADPES